jgi:hypothetical protein
MRRLLICLVPHGLTFCTRGCATHKDPAAIIADEQHFRNAWANIASINDVSSLAATPIPIVFHVIQKSNDLAGGNIPDTMVQAQIDAMNQHYAYVINSRFKLSDTDTVCLQVQRHQLFSLQNHSDH